MKDSDKYYLLWNKTEEYSKEEFSFLKKYPKIKNITVSYGFYKNVSSKGKQIAVVFDLSPQQTRRSGVQNHWEIICTRKITDSEIEEYIIHYFRNASQRFWVFYYSNIDKLIYDDKKLKAITPELFIDQCRKKGYSGTYQLKIDYHSYTNAIL